MDTAIGKKKKEKKRKEGDTFEDLNNSP